MQESELNTKYQAFVQDNKRVFVARHRLNKPVIRSWFLQHNHPPYTNLPIDLIAAQEYQRIYLFVDMYTGFFTYFMQFSAALVIPVLATPYLVNRRTTLRPICDIVSYMERHFDVLRSLSDAQQVTFLADQLGLDIDAARKITVESFFDNIFPSEKATELG